MLRIEPLSRFLPIVLAGLMFVAGVPGIRSASPEPFQAGKGSPAGRPNTIQVFDTTLGMQRGTLQLLPGWHGSAQEDRTTDPLSYDVSTLATNLVSPDGQAHFVTLPIKFHTIGAPAQVAQYMPGNPLSRPNAYVGRFTSTAELMDRRILPLLTIAGQREETKRMDPRMAAQIAQQNAGSVPGPIFDMAETTFHDGAHETLVVAVTMGSNAGNPREGTDTTVFLVSAPAGKAHGIYEGQFTLLNQMSQPSPSYLQAEAQFLKEWRDVLEEHSRRETEAFQVGNQQILAQGHANVAAMQARGAARDRAFAEQQQRNSDLGAKFRDYLGGTTTQFKWCSASNVQWTDSAAPPGPGYRRCQ